MSSGREELPVERDLLDNRFPRSYRLRKSAEFNAVFKSGRKVITPTLIFHYTGNKLDHPRLGLAVSRKVGKAVKRNKIKRRIREAFRLTKGSFPSGYDLVVYPRKGALEKHFEDYLQAFDVLIRKISRSRK